MWVRAAGRVIGVRQVEEEVEVGVERVMVMEETVELGVFPIVNSLYGVKDPKKMKGAQKQQPNDYP